MLPESADCASWLHCSEVVLQLWALFPVETFHPVVKYRTQSGHLFLDSWPGPAMAEDLSW